MKNNINKINKEISKLQEKSWKLEREEINKVQIPYLKSLVGKCFIYKRNSYSCPRKKSDYWDVYRKILDFYFKDDSLVYIIEEFSTDSQGKTEISVEADIPFTNKAWHKKIPFTGYAIINNSIYDKQKEEAINEMKNYTKLKRLAYR